ncbi:RPA-related protein RADX isoform X2 [Genypterus blacodes]|uniref:RPA-related protein RADX isoform X2 n=1 Tax=Genypterus blacodes TaxID=154954 RepID=UPI003F76B0A2
MAAAGCVFHRILTRTKAGPHQPSSSSPAVCRESLHVVDLQRYTRDQGSSVYFPQAVLHGEDLYDVTVTDGDCRLRATLDPGLNRLVERNILRPGATLRNSAFTTTMAAQLPQSSEADGNTDNYRLVSVEVKDQAAHEEDEDGLSGLGVDPDSLAWFGSSLLAGPLIPLRANRNTFLPLWNNVDYSGAVWGETPPTEEEEEEEYDEEKAQCPAVTVRELRESFLSGQRVVNRGLVIVRIINKSHLMYYGKTGRNSECPYKALLEVCDRTGSVCVVLWNSVCVSWYCSMRPGDIISLSRYRVKPRYQAEHDIEISVNSRNPTTRICIVPESSVFPECVPPAPKYNFYISAELSDRPPGTVCDVIGLLTFSGRPERIRSNGCIGSEFLEYRWLRLEDGTSDQPIMVKLFSTSQPDTHCKLHPLSVVVCTRLKLIRSASQTDGCFYLTNTTYTQVYCTGLGHHGKMPYRELRPVKHFLQWLRSQHDDLVMRRALVGGFFSYPPPPISLETYMKERKGQPGFLRGAELKRELQRLCYRERRTFCIQAAITMVTYCQKGEEDRSLFWNDRASSLSASPSSASPSPSSHLSFLPPLHSSTAHAFHPTFSSPSSSSLSSSSPFSAVSHLTPRRLDHKTGMSLKRKQLLAETPRKRLPYITLKPEQNNKTVILFEASMEFIEKNDDEDGESTEEDASSFLTAPAIPTAPLVAPETLPMRYCHVQREEQAAAMAMGGRMPAGKFDSASESYYTLRLRALSDSVMVDAFFLPHSSSSSLSPPLLPHSNCWSSILRHGAFSSHTPPPSPADLIAMASQLANQRMVCILEACHLGGTRTELVLIQAFQLTD